MIRLTLLAMIKDEQTYLPEWIEYHLGLGFSKVYLIEDFNSTSHASVVEKYGDKVFLCRCDNDKIDIKDIDKNQTPWRQVLAYNRFFNVYPEERENNYCLFLDMDEFLNIPKEDFSLFSYIERSGRDVFRIPMLTFNANKRVLRPSINTTEAYTKQINDKEFSFYCKTMINVEKDYVFHCIQRASIRGQKHPVFEYVLKINHYFTKSWEDWLIRMRRGSQDPDLHKLEDFFKYNPEMVSIKNYLISNYKMNESSWLSGGKAFLPSSYKEDLKNLGYSLVDGA